MTIKSTTILDQIKPEDRNLLQSKTLIRKFGRPILFCFGDMARREALFVTDA